MFDPVTNKIPDFLITLLMEININYPAKQTHRERGDLSLMLGETNIYFGSVICTTSRTSFFGDGGGRVLSCHRPRGDGQEPREGGRAGHIALGAGVKHRDKNARSYSLVGQNSRTNATHQGTDPDTDPGGEVSRAEAGREKRERPQCHCHFQRVDPAL